jgi:hypothetical protein
MSTFNQLRMATARQIAEDPVVVIPMRRALVLNDYGEWVASGAFEAQPACRIRIQDEASSVPKTQETPVGLDTALSKFALTGPSAPLLEGDEFAAIGELWVVGPVNVVRYDGRVYKTEAPLQRVTPVPVTRPDAFAAEAIDHESIHLSWADVGAANSYRVEREGEGGVFAEIATVAAGVFEYDDEGLDPETEYTYRLRAYDGFAYSEYAGPVSATTEVVP